MNYYMIRWLLSFGAMACGMIVASVGLMGVTYPDAFKVLLLNVVPERVGYLFLAMGSILWLNYITTTDDSK